MKLFNSLCCLAASRILLLIVITSGTASIAKSQHLKSKFLPPGSLIFRAFDNNIDGTGGDYIGITSLVYIETGDKFSLTNAKFISNENSTHWESQPRKSFSSIEIEYLGLDPIEPATNFCFYIGIGGEVDLIDIYMNGQPTSENLFNISESIEGITSNINISSIESNTLYITQGEWHQEGNHYKLSGNVIDGINIGSSLSSWQSTGIPTELDGTTLSTGDDPGDYYGILDCNGAVYVCDFADIQPILDNWLLSTQTPIKEIDPQDFCDHLCDVICEECVVEITLEVNGECELTTGEINCVAPFEYNWQLLQDGEWINLSINTSIDGTIDPLEVYTGNTYRLQVICDQFCEVNSDPIDPENCEPECPTSITGSVTDCYLSVTVGECNFLTSGLVYSWYRLVGANYVLIGTTTQPNYQIDQDGDYKVVVSGCGDCEALEYFFTVDEIEIFSYVNYVTCCDYLVCVPIATGAAIKDIILTDGTSLSTAPELSFDYYNTDPSLDALVEDINQYLDQNNLKGEASWRRNYTLDPKVGNTGCLAENGDIGFELLITDGPDNFFESVRVGNNVLLPFTIMCHSDYDGYILEVDLPCEDYVSIVWSDGTTDSPTIQIPSSTADNFTVTVECPNGCIWTTDYYFFLVKNNQSKIADDNVGTLTNNKQDAFEEEANIPSNINNEDSSDFIKYGLSPNPSLGMFKITRSDYSANTLISIHITSIRGKKVASYENIELNEQSSHQMNLSDLSAGVYLINIMEGLQVFTQKLVLIK